MFKRIKFVLGCCIGFWGAGLWELAGLEDNYADLKWYGKIGYNVMMTGLNIAGISLETIEECFGLVDARQK